MQLCSANPGLPIHIYLMAPWGHRMGPNSLVCSKNGQSTLVNSSQELTWFFCCCQNSKLPLNGHVRSFSILFYAISTPSPLSLPFLTTLYLKSYSHSFLIYFWFMGITYAFFIHFAHSSDRIKHGNFAYT